MLPSALYSACEADLQRCCREGAYARLLFLPLVATVPALRPSEPALNPSSLPLFLSPSPLPPPLTQAAPDSPALALLVAPGTSQAAATTLARCGLAWDPARAGDAHSHAHSVPAVASDLSAEHLSREDALALGSFARALAAFCVQADLDVRV